jgi:hypothetical protein
MISAEVFEAVKREYGNCASWAVWAEVGATPKSNLGDLTVLDPALNPTLLHTLHTNFVLLGLNISHPITCSLANFHKDKPTGPAYKIRYALKGTPLWGAYMTDVIKNFAEPISGNMLTYIRQHPDFERAQIEKLRAELALVGATHPVLVAFGQIAHTLLQRHFAQEFRIMLLPHYADHGSQDKYRAQVAAQLSQFMGTVSVHERM